MGVGCCHRRRPCKFRSPHNTEIGCEPLIERTVALCTSRPWAVIAIALVLTLAGLYVTVTRFPLNTNTERLISEDEPWLQTLKDHSEAFSRGRDLIVAVV